MDTSTTPSAELTVEQRRRINIFAINFFHKYDPEDTVEFEVARWFYDIDQAIDLRQLNK